MKKVKKLAPGPIHSKVKGSALGLALATIIAGILQRRGITLTIEEVGALGLVLSFVGGYVSRDEDLEYL